MNWIGAQASPKPYIKWPLTKCVACGQLEVRLVICKLHSLASPINSNLGGRITNVWAWPCISCTMKTYACLYEDSTTILYCPRILWGVLDHIFNFNIHLFQSNWIVYEIIRADYIMAWPKAWYFSHRLWSRTICLSCDYFGVKESIFVTKKSTLTNQK